jgi:hypothetical protein
MKLSYAFILFLMALLHIGCSGDNPQYTGGLDSQVLTINPQIETINRGETQQYQAVLTTSTGEQDVTDQVVWSVDDTAKATINSSGLAVAEDAGEVIIRADLDGLSATATLQVASNIDSQVLTISPLINRLNVGTSAQYQAVLVSQQGGQVDVTNQALWLIDEASLATVNNSGSVLAQAEGEAIISATFNDLVATSSLIITDKTLQSLKVSPIQATTLVGLETQFFSTAIFDDGSTQDVTLDSNWSSDSSAVSVDTSTGLVLAELETAPNVAVIRADFAGQSAEADLVVTNANVIALRVDPANSVLPIDNLQAYRASLVLGTVPVEEVIDVSQQVVWSVADDNVASISNEDFNRGLLQALTAGDTNVVAELAFSDIFERAEATLSVVPISLVSLAVSPADLSVVRGTTGNYIAIGSYNNDEQRNVTSSATWVSSNNSIVNIQANGAEAGNAYAVVPGESSISAALSGVSAATSVTVISPALTRIEVFPVDPSRPKGASQPFNAVAYFVDGNSQDVTQLASWQSSNEAIAELEPRIAGQVKTINVGSSDLSATWNGLSASSLLTVTGALPESLKIVPANEIIPRNIDSNYRAYLRYSDNSTEEVTGQVIWSSLDETIATISNGVDDEGRVHSILSGTTQINASLSIPAFSDSASLLVLSSTVNFVRPSCLPKTVAVGEQITCTCEAKLSGTDDLYDCTAFASYNESPNNGRLIFSTMPEKRNVATALSAGPANVLISFSGAGSNSSVNIE